MKKIFLAFVLTALFLAGNIKSQEISYIIPDIGTPDFYTYVEVIGPHDEFSNFGEDGLYLNNPGDDMRLEVVNPEDTNRVTIGPFVVSWEGRMIGAHFYVHPDQEPNSEYWDDLEDQFRIPIRVVTDGVGATADVDTFYIVQPTQLGDLSSGDGTIIGQGDLGKRSRRGAMIIDDVKFAEETYRISTLDCDPYTDGNQAFLPFVLLSTGNIDGENCELNLDGGYTVFRDAAPGGGGGGGRICDVASTSGPSGDKGGNGFTSGGRGGQNHVIGDGDNLEDYGESSGANGESLNEVSAPFTPFAIVDSDTVYSYESAGGGTGHPFGECGVGSGSWAPYDDHPGGYGGGSGYGYGSGGTPRRGGSGSFSSQGTNSTDNSSTAGNVHGNEYLIPLAGGSGGASGNPVRGLWPDVCSGNGAGGGGAARIFAKLEIKDILVSAKGGDGQGGDPAGGSGSGGGIDVLSKKVLDAIAEVHGGQFSATNYGGTGRISWAAETILISPNSAFLPGDASIFQSMTTDTNKLVTRKFNLEGTANEDKTIRIFLKPEHGIWEEVTGINYLGQTWDADIELTGTDTLYFLSAIIETGDGANFDEYRSRPDYMHTQASANIFIVDKLPRCTGDSVMNFYPMQCDGSEDLDTAYVKNTGEGNLILEMQNHSYANNTPGFELISPVDETIVLPEDSAEVIVRYSYQEGQPANLTDTLLIPHNDLETEKNPWQIELNVEADTIHIEYWDALTLNEFDRLVFGDNCINSEDTILFYIANFSDFPVTMEHIFVHTTGTAFSLQYPEGNTVEADSSLRVIASFNPDIVGLNESMLIFGIEECDTYSDTLYLEGDDVTGEFEFFNTPDTLDLGEICIGDETSETFWVKNLSVVDVTFEDPGSSETDFIPELIGKRNVPPDDTSTFIVRFSPTVEGEQVARVTVFFQECGGDFDTLYVKGTGTKANIIYEAGQPDPIDFGKVCVGEEETLEVIFRNGSLGGINIIGPEFSDDENFYGELLGPAFMGVDDTILVSATFAPKSVGTFDGVIKLSTDDCGQGKVEVPVTGEGVGTEIELIGTGLFEDTNVGERDTIEVTLRNNGEGDAYIETLPNLGTQFRIIDTDPALPILIAEGESITITIEFAPNSEGEKTEVMIVESVAKQGACNTTASILLKGLGIRTDIRVSTFLLDYGLLAWCESTQDSVIIANDGSTTFSITELAVIEGADAGVFVIAQQPQPDATPTLQPGDSAVYYIRFVPEKGNEGAKNAQLVIKTDADNLPEIRIDLIGESEDLHLDYNVSSLDFGDVAIGESADIDITLLNEGRIDWRVELLSIQPDVTITPTGLTIDGNTSEQLIATFSPSQEGLITAEIDLVLHHPCGDTISPYIIFSGRGVGGDIIIPDTLDLGVIYNCGILNGSLDMTNSGEANIEILDMTIIDDPESHFDYPDDQTFPVEIEPGMDFGRAVIFYGNEAPDGFYYAKAIITVVINNDTTDLEVILKAEIDDGLSIDPTSLDYGYVLVGESEIRSFTIENTGEFNLTITALTVYDDEYTLSPDWQTILPRTLLPGESITFDVEFAPDTEDTNYDSRIEVLYNAENCPEEIADIDLIGSSVSGKSVHLNLPWLDDVDPNIDDYSIPVYAFSDEDISDSIKITAEVSFSATLIDPISITNGNVIDESLLDGIKYLTFEILINENNPVTTQESVVAEINCATLLGNIKEGIIIWNKLDYQWEPLNYVTETSFSDGYIRLNICEKGGERLLNYDDLFTLKIHPNPANDNFEVNVTALEIGWHSLEIMNIHGETTLIDNWQVMLDGKREFTFNIETSGLSSGTYYVVVRSPTDIKAESIFIIK